MDPRPSESKTLDLEVLDLSRGGAGVSKDPLGRVVFIPFTAPGDLVRVRILEESKTYCQAEVVETLRASPIRQTPPCAGFGQCGGCQWQHLPYDFQWKTKTNGVRHTLARVGVSSPGAWDELPAERIWEYRNRVQLRGFQSTLGFYASKSHEIVPLNRCEIARPEINAAWEEIRKEGMSSGRPYKVEVEVLPDGSIRKVWNSSHASGGFRQIHDEQNEKLKEWVAGALKENGVLLDLYGGSGNLSVPLSERFAQVHCVDVSAPQAGQKDISPLVQFHRKSVLSWLFKQKTDAFAGRSVSAIADPPREGLGKEAGELETALRRLGVREWVLIGCDADAWARDLLKLTQGGWRFERAAILDLFPQTRHVESLALLRL